MATAASYPPQAPSGSYQYQQPQYQQAPLQYHQQQQLPPPPPPHQHQPPQQPSPTHTQLHSAHQRPNPPSRKSRSFSFRSDKSHGSGSHKNDVHETISAEKESRRLHNKADPTLAMQEAEPAEVAAQVKSSLAPLRSIQHKDVNGVVIAEPDRSNPTRSRWERPLDTIRSFEAAIDGRTYSSSNNRKSMLRSDTDSVAWNRRSSYYGGSRRPHSTYNMRGKPVLTTAATDGPGPRFAHDSYYGGRPVSTVYSSRPEGSQPDLRHTSLGGNRDSYYDQQSGHHGGGPNQRGRGWPRMNSEPQFHAAYRQQATTEYTLPSNHRSYETVASASGSGTSGEPAGYQTDPTSSDNSSIERVQSALKPQAEPVNDYGIGFSQTSPYQPSAFTVGVQNSIPGGIGAGAQQQGSSAFGYGSPQPSQLSQPPQPPKKDNRVSILRKPTAAPPPAAQPQQQTSPTEKRKSWFSRRFSKHG